ncbi:pyridoxamine kinase [Endozoicomonas montiporae]|uniref:pyridoxal kinase n=2 Tax=Endozoicomonas montiporae TaxID=1027273 RepID=A0A081MYZ7_9GAMM|nr:pyridoxal kinase PdxY [Endozoicomonas montiporae]AMO54890.1 pyridoxal kinase [Endozoicomonas montiporae CL-33]KEQ11420.1 pyridoxamine kinase [Endozoicomonas montiporae]
MNILSIQSHVAVGHAGNSSAVFPLQRLGFNVWPVNTVMFSNHTGHPGWRGPVFTPETVREVLLGMEEHGAFAECDAILSGYMGDPGMAEVILDAVERIRSANPDVLYCCDPVIGDVDTGIYVQKEIPDFFRNKVIQQANIITPNHFELQMLTGRQITTIEQAVDAAKILLAEGPDTVLVTSLITEDCQNDQIAMLAVNYAQAWLVKTPMYPMKDVVSGSGDATAALFLAKLLQSNSLQHSLEHIAGAMHGLFKTTSLAGSPELQLIAAQDELMTPSVTFSANPVTF